MTRRGRQLVVAAAFAAIASCAQAAAAGEAPDVDAASTGPHSELRKTVPISRHRGAAPRIVLEMGPGRLSGLRRDDRLELSSEVQVTVDCDKPQPRCAGRPYDFDPRVVASLELGSRKSLGGRTRVLARTELTCRQKLPARQHHCPITFDETIRVGDHFPCRLDHCFARVVVSAHSAKARGGERMIIGANKPSGRIVQNKSRLNAVWIAPGVHGQRLRTGKLRRRTLRLRPQRKVVLSQRVDDLHRGDVLTVSAAMRSDVRQLDYNALVGAQLIVARGPKGNSPSRLVRRSVWQEGLISPLNGTNCTPVQSPCPTRKVGVVKVRREVQGGSGAPAPLFVNLIVRTKQKRVGREHGDRLRILDDARLVVRHYRP
ncbi:MAG: hypothetical protein ACJ75R_05930 [Solirubrobacterales bacterium]